MRVICALLALVALAVAVPAEIGFANVRGTAKDSGVFGTVYFVQYNTTHIWVWPDLHNITVNPDTQHGIHVHQYGDITNTTDGTSAGAHYVGAGSASHGCENTTVRHEGDMGNWQATAGAITGQSKYLDLAVISGANSIIGKAVVLHQQMDDCSSATATGNAGTRLAFGVISIANVTTLPAQVLAQIAGGAAPTANNASSSDASTLKAVVVLFPTTASTTYTNVHGFVSFSQDTVSGAITVTARISGLNPAQGFGIHIHTSGDYSANGIMAGGHFNPNTSQTHGAPPSLVRHAGDLGNICSYDTAGMAYYQYTVTDGAFSLTDPSKSIIGRNVIVHAFYDTALPTTDFGARIASGVVGVYNPASADFATVASGVTVQAPNCSSFAPTGAPTMAPTMTPTMKPTMAPTTAPTTNTPAATTSSSSFVSLSVSSLFLAALLVLLF